MKIEFECQKCHKEKPLRIEVEVYNSEFDPEYTTKGWVCESCWDTLQEELGDVKIRLLAKTRIVKDLVGEVEALKIKLSEARARIK